jgi:hypothetical protein
MYPLKEQRFIRCGIQSASATSHIRNFINAANHSGKLVGIYYDDSDVYKALEAMNCVCLWSIRAFTSTTVVCSRYIVTIEHIMRFDCVNVGADANVGSESFVPD